MYASFLRIALQGLKRDARLELGASYFAIPLMNFWSLIRMAIEK